MQFIATFLLAVVGLFALISCQTVPTKSATEDTSAKSHEVTAKKTDSADKRNEVTTSAEETVNKEEHNHQDEVKRISVKDAKELFDSGEAVFVDARSKNSYINEHIKGAINIPVKQTEKRYEELPKDKKIIVYCS